MDHADGSSISPSSTGEYVTQPEPPHNNGGLEEKQTREESVQLCVTCIVCGDITTELCAGIPCHKRKVKCDRTRPCHGCVKRGEPSACVWETEEPNAELPGDERDKLLARIHDLENTLVKIRRGDAPAELPHSLSSSHPPLLASVNLSLPNPHPLAVYTQGGGPLDELKNFPFSNLWEGDTVDVLFDILPPKDGSDRVLNVFWTHFESCHPVYSRTDFVTLYEAFYLLGEDQQRTYHPSVLAMFFAVWALGMLFSGGDDRVKKLPYEVLPGETVTQARQRAAKATAGVFASGAWHALRAASFLSAPTIHTVAALIWLELYLMHEDRPKDTWILHGMTFRMVVHLLQEPGGEVAKERLWRYVVYQEAYLSLTFGEPGVPLSNMYPRPAVANMDLPSPTDSDAQYEHAMVRLAVMMERVVAAKARGAPPTDLRVLDQEIRAWRGALPAMLDEDAPGFDITTAGPRIAHQTMKLALEYHNMHMFLHRGYEERCREGSPEWMYAKEMFAQAMHGVIECWLKMERAYPGTFIANVWLGYLGILASLESCAYALRHPSDEWRSKAKADVQKIVAVFHDIKGTNPVAAKGVIVLEAKLAALS